MKCVRRESIDEDFEVCPDSPIPGIPTGGARVKVFYAGACYTDRQVKQSGKKRLRSPGVQDTSLFPGYEVSGVVDAICNTRADSPIAKGDKVVVYPEGQELLEIGYAEYIIVPDVRNLIKVPDTVPLKEASLLPCGALRAYSAVQRANPLVQLKMLNNPDITTVLIVGAGGLGLWTLKLAQQFISGDCKRIHVVVADTNIEKLMVAKDQGCFDVIHWNDSIHEEYILERTKDVCAGGVDLCIDFVSSPRTINRAMKVLKEEGILMVGGHSKYEISFGLDALAERNQSIMGVNRGSREQLQELVDIFAAGMVTPPVYSVFPVDEASRVFEQLDQCKINGRAILQVCREDAGEEEEEGDDDAF